jgi:hypothetical protein
MPKPYPAEFHLRVVASVDPGKSLVQTMCEIESSTGALHHRVHRYRFNPRESPSSTSQRLET